MKNLEITMQLLSALSIIIASTVAIYGINSWRRETKWKIRFDIAQQILTCLYQIKDAFRHLRSPAVWSSEIDAIIDNDSEKNRSFAEYGKLIQNRYNTYTDLFGKMNGLKYQFMSVFGKSTQSSFDDVNGLLNNLFFTASRYTEHLKEVQIDPSLSKLDREETRKYQEILWQTGSKENQFDKKLNTAIQEIENVCMTYIGK